MPCAWQPNDFEPMPYDGSDIFAPKPLAMLTSSEVLAVLRNAHRKVLAEGDFISELDLTCFLAPFRARKKGQLLHLQGLPRVARFDGHRGIEQVMWRFKRIRRRNQDHRKAARATCSRGFAGNARMCIAGG